MTAAQSEASQGPARQSQPPHPIGPRDKKVYQMLARILNVYCYLFLVCYFMKVHTTDFMMSS